MITIQAGNYANFVGAHFFNLQNPETSGHDEGENILWQNVKQGISHGYVPRVVAFDTKENVTFRLPTQKTTGVRGAPSAEEQDHAASQLWGGQVQTIVRNEGDEDKGDLDAHAQNPASSSYGVSRRRDWTDSVTWRSSFDHLHFLPNFSHNPETGQLETFAQGMDIWKSMEEQGEDSVRKYAEQCDRLQGFNVLVDQLNGYSGLGAGILQYIADEYEKKCVLGFPVTPPYLPSQEKAKARSYRSRLANTVLLWNALNSHSSVFMPIGLCEDFTEVDVIARKLPYLNYSDTFSFESSAVIASALNTLLAPSIYTSEDPNNYTSLDHLSSFLGAFGRKLAPVSTSFPYPINAKSSSLFKSLQGDGVTSLTSITPGVTVDCEKATGNYFVIKGIQENCVITEKERRELMGLRMKDAQSCLDTFVKERYPKSVNLTRMRSSGLKITEPFPICIVESEVREQFSSSKEYSRGIANCWSMSALSAAHNTTNCENILNKLLDQCAKRKSIGQKITQTLPSFNELQMEEDDFLDAINSLDTLSTCYSKVSE